MGVWGILSGSVAARATSLGVLHALVDTVSMVVLYHEVALQRLPYESLCQLVLVYNCVAFGLQPPLGLLCDLLGRPRLVAVFGILVSAVALALCDLHPLEAAVTVGVGNALYHVGAGSVVLRMGRGRAVLAGLFVGPGALGVWMGIWLGSHGGLEKGILALALGLAAGYLVAMGEVEPADDPPASPGAPSAVSCILAGACVLALLGSVGIRAVVGGAFSGAWSVQGPAMPLALALVAVLGKGMGGALADRLGWRLVGAGSLIVLAPLVSRALLDPGSALLCTWLAQLSMAITLAAVYGFMPRWPATAFGLPSFALLLGALPGQVEAVGQVLEPALMLGTLVTFSAVLLMLGLSWCPSWCGDLAASGNRDRPGLS